MQWQAFDRVFLDKCGVPTYPFDRQPIGEEVLYQHSGYGKFCYIACTGIYTHSDSDFHFPYSAFLVISNCGLIAKPSHIPKSRLEPQYPGTILILDVRKKHHLVSDKRISRQCSQQAKLSPMWVAVRLECEQKPDQVEIESKFRKFLGASK